MYIDKAMNQADAWVGNWWLVCLRGLVAVMFALMTFVLPGISLAGLVLAFGAYAFADGVLTIVGAVRRRPSTGPRWLTILNGLVGVSAGVATVLWPELTALALVFLIASWAIVGGVFEIVAAIRLRKEIQGEWLLALSGVLSIALGVSLVLFPGPGALALVIWMGAYSLVAGIALFALGVRLRAWGKKGVRREMLASVAICNG